MLNSKPNTVQPATLPWIADSETSSRVSLVLFQKLSNAGTIVRVSLREVLHSSLLDEFLGVLQMASNVLREASLLLLT